MKTNKRLIDIHPYTDSTPIKNGALSAAEIEKYLSSFFGRPAVVLGSARIGIYEALKFFNLSRRDHILTPDFLCRSMMNIISLSGIPVINIAPRLKAVLVFHQWGYPQDMDNVLEEAKRRDLLVIEDCVHSLDSKYKGQNVGTFGDVAIFSFSKIFSTYAGGVLISENKRFIDFVKKDLETKKGFKNWLSSRLFFWAGRKIFDKKKEPYFMDAISLNSINFPNIDKKTLKLCPQNLAEFKELLSKRNNNYLFLIITIF